MQPAQKSTIKQAKAAYRRRVVPAVSEKEKRQIERELELEKRASRIKQQEKRRKEALQKRAEKDIKRKAEENARLGSQRRRDKYGFKSSQVHLGVFFGADSRKEAAKPNEPNEGINPEQSCNQDLLDDLFEEEVDDQTLLDATVGIEKTQNTEENFRHRSGVTANTSAPASSQTDYGLSQELNLTEHELGLITHIERATADPSEADWTKRLETLTDSFSSGGLELAGKDIETLDPTRRAVKDKPSMDQEAMPPPRQPTVLRAQCENVRFVSPQAAEIVVTPPLNSALTRIEDTFTSSQLQSFFDDDFQLTQACPS